MKGEYNDTSEVIEEVSDSDSTQRGCLYVGFSLVSVQIYGRTPPAVPRPDNEEAPPIALSHQRTAPPSNHHRSKVAPSADPGLSPGGAKSQTAHHINGLGAGHPPVKPAPAPAPGHPLVKPGPAPAHKGLPAVELVAPQHAARSSPPQAPRLKHILYWNEFYGSMEFMWGSGQQPFIDHGCKVNTCFGTNNRTLLPMHAYDAILFHVQTLPFFDWPRVRSPHQRYVFVTRESPQYLTIPLGYYDNLFNLTLTYRRDSDFPYPDGTVVPVPSPPSTSTRNYAAGKTKLVAWFVSHCTTMSSREKYVKMLQKHIPVDIYGGCGPFKCPRTADDKCHKTLLNKDYKFYLSFENSICNDYVTEKLFSVLEHDVVPVVLGGANYSSFAPPGSYIDALKYTPKELAKYLLKLDKDDTAYNEYFQWKGKYRNAANGLYKNSSFCDLCKYLHGSETKVYKSVKDWWTKGQCKKLKIH